MNKKQIVITLIIFFSILIVAYLIINKSSSFPVTISSTYLNYSNSKKSNIFTNCKSNSDCKLIPIEGGCGGFHSINSNNSNIEIEKYNNKEKELLLGIVLDCGPSIEINEYNAVCKNNICASEKK